MVPLIAHLRTIGLSARDARRALDSGKVHLRGVPVGDPAREVDPADVTVRPNAPRLVPGRDPALVFHDRHLAVVNKPSGLLSVPAPGRRDPHVLGFVRRVRGNALAVHRLDEATSGVMVVAVTEAAQRALKRQFEVHDVERRYLAIVDGAFRGARTIRSHLVRDRGDGLRGSSDDDHDAREAITHLRAVEPLRGATLLEAMLETGRTHQVRIHCAEAGHVVLGDDLYGSAAGARRAPRLALHAAVLAFDHPVDGRRLRFDVPLADDLERLRRQWRTSHPPEAP
jgi:23S rRNA pseudouridine1911/1915/1917 synthase